MDVDAIKEKIVSPTYDRFEDVSSYAQRVSLAEISSTANDWNLNTTLLAHLIFAFPRKQEQKDIATQIDETDATIQKELANVLKLGLSNLAS